MNPSYVYKALITGVIDGDTVDAEIDLGFKIKADLRLRIARIDTPELNSQDSAIRLKALEAKQYVIDTILLKQVVITTTKPDKYGRYLAEIYYSDFNLSDKLLEMGLAVKYV